MSELNWELSVLGRAVVHKNLMAAADHVGISQPQLSRIVSKLESLYEISLLDREARRKSGWLPAAFRLAESYSKTVKHFHSEVLRITEQSEPEHVKIGSLEGLRDLTMGFCHRLFQKTKVTIVELDVFDLNVLEELFLKGELDFILTSREPGRKKYKFTRSLGYQSMETIEKKGIRVLSTYDYASRKVASKKKTLKMNKMFVSNSLLVREKWLNIYGGSGYLPSPIRKQRSVHKKEVPVLMIGNDTCPPRFWDQVKGMF